MLEILMSNGGNVTPIEFSFTRNQTEINSGEAGSFEINYTGGADNAVYYWTLESTGAGYIDTPTKGQFLTDPEGTVISFNTVFDESFDGVIDVVLKIWAGEGGTGKLQAESDPIRIIFTQHPIGQKEYIDPGVYDFVVPEGVRHLQAVCIGGGQGAYDEPMGRGGHGADLRWRNNIEVTAGDVLTIEVGEGGTMSRVLETRNGKSSSIFKDGQHLLRASGGGRTESTPITIEMEDRNWVIPEEGDVIGGGNGGLAATAVDGAGPSGGGGAGGYLGDGGRGGNRTTGASDGVGATGSLPGSGAAGGGVYYYTASNDSHHATAGGGVGLRGIGRTGERGEVDPDSGPKGGQGGSGGTDGDWFAAGIYGGGAKGQSSNNTFGGVNGGNGAVRLIWGFGRAFPRTQTDNL